jgi:hypothetical protein
MLNSKKNIRFGVDVLKYLFIFIYLLFIYIKLNFYK